jgi:hypothetical protein
MTALFIHSLSSIYTRNMSTYNNARFYVPSLEDWDAELRNEKSKLYCLSSLLYFFVASSYMFLFGS